MFTTLLCLSIVMAMPIVLAVSTIPFRFAQFGKPDLENPRLQAKQLSGAGHRLDAAQHNAWEALMLFIAALLFAATAGADFIALSVPALLFVSARILHAVFYVFDFGTLRFLTFMASLAPITWIVLIAFKSL